MLVSRRISALAAFAITAYVSHAFAKPTERASYEARRRAFRTSIGDVPIRHRPAPKPPVGVYELVQYAAPLGRNSAYVTPPNNDGKKRPAIVWLQGGFNWSIDQAAWIQAPRENDQSARAFREAGMIEMLPSLRGCNDNPGAREYFLGEVDDVLAAIDYLRKRPDVDPARVYLGGHSTGGTMALLVAASRPPIRAVFAFGPIADVGWYGKTGTGLDAANADERAIRSPIDSIGEIAIPVYVIEGDQRGNFGSFAPLAAAAGKATVRFLVAHGATHFSTLAPITELLASGLMREAAGGPAFDLSEAMIDAAIAKR